MPCGTQGETPTWAKSPVGPCRATATSSPRPSHKNSKSTLRAQGGQDWSSQLRKKTETCLCTSQRLGTGKQGWEEPRNASGAAEQLPARRASVPTACPGGAPVSPTQACFTTLTSVLGAAGENSPRLHGPLENQMFLLCAFHVALALNFPWSQIRI